MDRDISKNTIFESEMNRIGLYHNGMMKIVKKYTPIII